MRAPLLVVNVACLIVAACGPHSLAEAIVDRSDEFPRNSFVLIPPADIDRLGQTIEELGHRRARATGERCFDIAPVLGRGMSQIDLSYKAGSEFTAEVQTLADQAGGSLKSDDTATITLDNITVREGFGVPIRGSCDFSKEINVITSTVIAGTATLEFSRNIILSGRGGAGWAGGNASGSGAGSISHTGRLQGANIVIAAVVTPVRVAFTNKQLDLGTAPHLGTVVPFPDGYDGNIRIEGFTTATPSAVPVLTITASTRLSASAQNVPATLQACAVGQPVPIKPGSGCFIWNGNGSSGVNVWFEPIVIDGAEHFRLQLDGYESHFRPQTTRQ